MHDVSCPNMNVFVARQPIFDNNLQVCAYELLYRSSDVDSAQVIDGDESTSSVILNSFIEIGIDNITKGLPAYINLTRNFFFELKPELPHKKVVLELLEDIEPDDELISAIQQLSAKGYTIALDDFVLTNDGRDRLLPYVDIVKVDVYGLSPQQIVYQARELRRRKVTTLLAEKIETEQIMKLCRSCGFDYFQGFFLSRPSTLSRRSVSSSKLPLLRMIASLHEPDLNVRELEEIISQDLSLSYKLLRYLASPLFPTRNIDSIRSAILYLGKRNIANWATLLALSSCDDQPPERIVSLLIRGHTCEKLALNTCTGQSETAFTIGLFSGIDAVLDATLELVCKELPLSDVTKQALLHRSGPYGALLAATLAQEQGQWDAISQLGFPPALLSEIYIDAVRCADDQWAWLSQAIK